jgi:MoxR-like ATPase
MSVVYQLRGSILHKIRTGKPLLPQIDGREETKADVIRALLSGAHPYLVSEEGTGKTRLARSLTTLLPQIPIIKGCPYHDDPKWPVESLCPRCRASKNPAQEFGIEIVPGVKRFSRIQGNEYTNEAKLLGLKDIQAIVQGKSPSDPRAFTGTGVFRANRGILFIDELPAIRTKVQVLFHPILEEKKAILEEYNWEHPLDLVLIATGNPRGFSHVNEIPRPLLDRLEPIYMDLPDEDIEKEIMLKETFRVRYGQYPNIEAEEPLYLSLEDIVRKAASPWWVIDIVNKAVRYSRICPYVENNASIRATNRALDHTYASVEMENRQVTNLRHAYYGLRLALRARIGLRSDLIDFDNPKKTFILGDQLTEDFIWNVLEDMRSQAGMLDNCDRQKLGSELSVLLASEIDFTRGRVPSVLISNYDEMRKAMQWLRQVAGNRVNQTLISEPEKKLYDNDDIEVTEEYNYSALELLANICVHERTLDQLEASRVFIAHRFKD